MNKMIVCDIDGTIIRRDDYDDVISDYALNIYKEAMKNNIFVLATGRIFKNSLNLVNKYSIGHYLIGLNGAIVYNVATKTFLYKKKLSKKVCTKISAIVHKTCEKLYLCTLDNWNFYTDIEEYKHNLYSEEKLIDNPFDIIKNQDVYKFEVYFSNIEDTNNFIKKIKRLKISINVIERRYNRGYYVEIMYKGINKYYAVKKLSKKLKISNKNIITFGDNSNDYEMIKHSGLGIVVSNSSNDIKGIADKIIDHVNEDSVAKYIEENIL